MADATGSNSDPLFAALHAQSMAALQQVLLRFQNDAVTVSKAFDYAYLQDKNMVSLPEAVGVREVESRVAPAGPAPSNPVK